jgi:hypothetical protein
MKRKHQFPFKCRYLHVQNSRFCINPNPRYLRFCLIYIIHPSYSFKHQLREYEPLCRARRQVLDMGYSAEQNLTQGLRRRPLEVEEGDVDAGFSNKRRLDDDEAGNGDEEMRDV